MLFYPSFVLTFYIFAFVHVLDPLLAAVDIRYDVESEKRFRITNGSLKMTFIFK